MDFWDICKTTNFFEKILVKVPLFSILYLLFYKKAVETEWEFAGLLTEDKVLFIGGGAIPYSAIILSNKVKHITVIDNDKKSVNLAKKIINYFRINNITINYENGQYVNPKDYDVIFLPLQAQPKNKILANIKSHCHENTKILMRIPKKAFTKFYTPIKDLAIKNYKEKAVNQLTYNKIIMFYPGDIKNE
ncbi:Nicotianamine synthase protein [Anaerobranca californiensis DSM 14826]|jgi:16S rRNA G966 N2-methylase RsmD|uniref:Nicotianamine synthase protein n=1 Tax=Anaerobranca californiensis DSM 14826 TaxID=1120989 RepID=A0A1M6KXI0_9FIRM|nr:nicotianamine synthase family protein [Anaerobranca californiensis]SHJ63673.1 Nicotianamine synthase protein [Anaerobranca californiensis DSM 14826]